MTITRPTIMEINLKSLEHNIKEIKKYIGPNTTIMPIIKANAYGTYINYRPDIINQFSIVGVAIVDEAIELRNNGYTKEIFILNQPFITEIDKLIEYNLTVGLSEINFLKEIVKRNKQIKVHIEIDTGMGRTGIPYTKTKEFIKEIKKYPQIEIEGIYTHLSSADCDEEYTKLQLNKFNQAVIDAKSIIGNIKYIHACASNGLLNYSTDICNLVRPGIILYGYNSFDNANKKINIQPICKLKSKITYLKTVEEGTSISYSRNYITTKKTIVATIPIGYADGLPRSLSNKGKVVINNQLAPIIGNICMDSIMVDMTHINNVHTGDDVYIWDNKLITIEDIAKATNTINYEILCTISNRVPRKYTK